MMNFGEIKNVSPEPAKIEKLNVARKNNKFGGCILCGEDCEKLNEVNQFCCLHVPTNYITKVLQTPL